MYKIKDIIDEDRTRYHIRWEGHDPKTGKPWPDTWEPKLNANKPAVEAWKKQKAEQRGTMSMFVKFVYSTLSDFITRSSKATEQEAGTESFDQWCRYTNQCRKEACSEEPESY